VVVGCGGNVVVVRCGDGDVWCCGGGDVWWWWL